jgi:hypothetical protein
MQRVLSAASQRPNMIPDTFMAYIIDYIQANNLTIPIGQVSGFTPYANEIADQQATLAATQVTLAAQSASIANAAMTAFLDVSGSLSLGAGTPGSAAGPTLTGLTPGKFILQAGFDASGINGPSLTLSTGDVITDNPRAFLATLSGTSVTSTLAGTGGGAGGSISHCWLLGLRYTN